jgi:hypothetical protein
VSVGCHAVHYGGQAVDVEQHRRQGCHLHAKSITSVVRKEAPAPGYHNSICNPMERGTAVCMITGCQTGNCWCHSGLSHTGPVTHTITTPRHTMLSMHGMQWSDNRRP